MLTASLAGERQLLQDRGQLLLLQALLRFCMPYSPPASRHSSAPDYKHQRHRQNHYAAVAVYAASAGAAALLHVVQPACFQHRHHRHPYPFVLLLLLLLLLQGLLRSCMSYSLPAFR
jgi:hypothetical protein